MYLDIQQMNLASIQLKTVGGCVQKKSLQMHNSDTNFSLVALPPMMSFIRQITKEIQLIERNLARSQRNQIRANFCTLYLGKTVTNNQFQQRDKKENKIRLLKQNNYTNERTFTSEIFLPGFLLEFEFSRINHFILCILLKCFRANHPRITAGTSNENIVSNRQKVKISNK